MTRQSSKAKAKATRTPTTKARALKAKKSSYHQSRHSRRSPHPRQTGIISNVLIDPQESPDELAPNSPGQERERDASEDLDAEDFMLLDTEDFETPGNSPPGISGQYRCGEPRLL
jgi:hypothetical protein